MALWALLFGLAWGGTPVVVRGELVVRKGQPLVLEADRSSIVRGSRCLKFGRPELGGKPWLVQGLQVEARVRAPAQDSTGCWIVEAIKPVVFDPGGATVRQGPPRPAKKAKPRGP